MIDPLWWVVIVIGAGTFFWRGSFLLFGRSLHMPDLVRRALNYVPPAVFAALVLPGLIQWQADGAVDGAKLAAGLLAGAVAWKTQGTVATLVAGMLGLWGLRLLGL